MYYDLLVKDFYVYMYVIIYIFFKIPSLLVLSVNNRYTGFVRANIRYDKNMGREIFLTEGGYFLNRVGVNTACPLCPGSFRFFNNTKKKFDFFIY